VADQEKFSIPDDGALERSMEKISAACEQLFFVSEMDAPVEPVALPRMTDLSPDALLEALGRSDEEPIQMAAATEFFDRLTRTQEWQSENEKKLIRRFAHLSDVLEDELEDIRLFRIGEVQVDIFVIGLTRGGTVAGVRTRAVET